MTKDEHKIAAAKLYNSLLPNGGSFHNLSPSTQTYKNFMKLAADIEYYKEYRDLYYSLRDEIAMTGYFDRGYERS